MTRGVPEIRKNAVQLCKEQSWAAGTKIRSYHWTSDREILDIGEKFVRVRILKKGTGSSERVISFPSDVRKI